MLASRRFWIGLAISLVFLAFFLYGANFEEIKRAFKDANYFIAALSLPVYFLGIWVRTIRWQYLLRPVARPSTARLYPVVIVGLMANNIIPARVGELVRAYVLGERERVSKASALGTIAVDRLFDGLTLIPMLLLFAPFVGGEDKFELGWINVSVGFEGLAVIMAVLFGIALAVLFVLAFSGRWRARIDGLIHRLTPARLRPSVEGIAHAFFKGLDSLRSPADMVAALLLSAVSWVLEATMYYIVGLAFDIHAGFQVYLVITAAANLAIAVLASQGGIGPFEFVAKQTLIAAAFGGASATPEQGDLATAYAIGLHALLLLPVIALGLYFLGTMGLSLGDMFRRSTLDDEPPDPTARAVAAHEETPT